jgi:hypothetical protein
MGRYARGGVLGFAGDKPEGSKVLSPEESRELIERNNAIRGITEAPGFETEVGAQTSAAAEKPYKPEEFSEETIARIGEMKKEKAAKAMALLKAATETPAAAASDKGIAQTLSRPTAARPPAAAAAPQGQVKPDTGPTAPTLPSYDDAELINLAGREKLLREKRTDFEGENIKGIEAAEAKRKALEASRVGSSAIDRLIAFTANAGYRPGGGGSRVAAFDKEQQQAARENLQAETLAAADIRKQKELQYNIKIGDVAAARQNQIDLIKLRQESAKTKAVFDTSIYGTDMQAQSDKLRQMGENQRNAATNAAHLKAASYGREGQQRIAALAADIARKAGRPEDPMDHVVATERYANASAAGQGVAQRDTAARAEGLRKRISSYDKDNFNTIGTPAHTAEKQALQAELNKLEGIGAGGGGGGGGGFTYVGPAGGK